MPAWFRCYMKDVCGQSRPYHWGMKTTYILGAILACSVTGTLVGARSAKTALLLVSAILAIYGLVRLLG